MSLAQRAPWTRSDRSILLPVCGRLLALLGFVLTPVARGQESPVSPPPAPTESTAPAENRDAIADATVSPEDAAFFEKRIRPILVAECYACHSSGAGEKLRAGLTLDSRSGMRRGGDSGPALVPGQPDDSLLIQAIRHTDPDRVMPPKKRLAADVVRDFEEWVRRGAPDPRPADGAARPESSQESPHHHWAFQPPRRTTPPEIRNTAWPSNVVDRFVVASLEASQLTPVEPADRQTLLRRITFDLTGLPPTPADVEAFAVNTAPDAFEQVVDQLLSSPRFGEKWARHWLDVARYAESTGKTVNFNYPHAWRYRDYVIAAFNADKPYPQFIREQLAGDLLPTDDPRRKAEQIIATGFLAIGPKTLNERNGLKFELDVVDEQIDVTTQAFLGITVACARCHDHKFDPIPQADYYALAGIFRSTETCYGTVSYINAQRTAPLLPLPPEAQPASAIAPLTATERQRIENQIRGVRESSQRATDGIQKFFASGQVSLLRSRLEAYDETGSPRLLAMGVRDKSPGPEPRRRRSGFGGPGGFTYDGTRTIADSPIYTRGESDQPEESRVPRGALRVISSGPLAIGPAESGRRELAEWIASPQNPLTARVMVNRIWLQLFGRGLVPTADDFGLAGRPPTHPELLDHLACRFIDQGGSVKQLIKDLVMSRVYQLGSQSSPAALATDPDNTLLWRMTPRRLDAESLRDALLAVSGQLSLEPPVGSVVARAGEGPVTRPRFGGDPIAAAINDPRNTQRSIYLPILRDSLPEALSLFDAADPSLITADRPQTTVPSQGLYLLNNEFVLRAADAAADRLIDDESAESRIDTAFVRFFSRPPTDRERARAEAFLREYGTHTHRNPRGDRSEERELWSALCQALFASAEFQYRR